MTEDSPVRSPIGPVPTRAGAVPRRQRALVWLITLVPISIGMALRQRFPASAQVLERQVSRLAAALLGSLILAVVLREGSRLPGFLFKAGLAVLLLNGLGTLVGHLAAKLLGLPLPQQICLASEVGIQNCTLAIAITAGLLRSPEMAVPAAVYGLWMFATGLVVVRLGRTAMGDRPAKLWPDGSASMGFS